HFDTVLLGLRHRLIGVMCNDAFIATCGEFSRGPTNTSRRFGLWTDVFSVALRDPEYLIDETVRLRNALREGQACYECLAPVNSFDDSRLVPNTGRAAHRSCFKRWAATLHPDRPPRPPRVTTLPNP